MKTTIYHFKLGEYEGFVLNDYSSTHTVEELVVNPNMEELEQLTQEYSFRLNEIPVDYNNLLIKVGNQNVLVDAGIRRPVGKLCLALEELKIDSREIDTLVITHSDRDHIGGILDEQGEITFPNARYIMLEDSWRNWLSEKRRVELTRLNKWTKDRTEFGWETYQKIRELMQIVKPGEEFIPGMRMFPAPGHRYDHSIMKVTSSGEQIVHISDALTHPIFMANKEWYSTYDANPVQAVETKTVLLNMCVAERALVFGAHFPYPGLGYVDQERESWKWQPIEDG